MGLMLAAELDSADLAKQVAGAMLEQRILINRTSETVLRFLPPFILGKDHVDHAIDALDSILTEHAPQTAGAPTTGGKNVG
jgi:acetylornithine aminotransferase/acetylornithine/N-succinyldiaminopimelate aminotransferase